MFKKPLSTLKTSAPLRGSDRRKLKQRVISSFGLSPEDGEILVPDGLLSVKFNTHLDEPGTVYLSVDGDPLWFTVGKGSEDLIPTVYTMWKRHTLLPFLSTPAAVIPVLISGADLMIPGVIHYPPSSLEEGQLVSISQYSHGENPTLSFPLAVGRMALASDNIRNGQEKGKAVYILHTWKDHLWDMGRKTDIPEPLPFSSASAGDPQPAENGKAESEPAPVEAPSADAASQENVAHNASARPYTADEISLLLHTSLLQALSTALSDASASSFPISASTFYSNYILPYRPAFPNSVLGTGNESPGDPQEISVKNSTYKSLTAFLKSAEKGSLLTVKAPPKHSQQTEVVVTAVNASHPSVEAHKTHVTVKDLDTRSAKKAQREERLKEEEQESARWVDIKLLWKPHLKSVKLFEAFGGSEKTLYELPEVRDMLNGYINEKALVNPREQAYINLDPLLSEVVAPKVKKAKATEPSEAIEFMKREEMTKKVLDQMQCWHEVKAPGKDPVVKKGLLKPIQVVTKMRQGRKACTLITGFEPFVVISADELAEDLRKLCAGATSVSPCVGGVPGLEVLVQGKQSNTVLDYLTNKGIPKEWIEVSGKK
ncbi:eukaryotic translation initiation factor SUI1 family protein [Favolaschia claudopus]|uniref:Eukaryotic translation initiation factor SUI1 family protein n=1 Tax=Favolaschia claudopus TaxID=2862362 RepID=A0AAW0DTX7_9AGAR